MQMHEQQKRGRGEEDDGERGVSAAAVVQEVQEMGEDEDVWSCVLIEHHSSGFLLPSMSSCALHVTAPLGFDAFTL